LIEIANKAIADFRRDSDFKTAPRCRNIDGEHRR